VIVLLQDLYGRRTELKRPLVEINDFLRQRIGDCTAIHRQSTIGVTFAVAADFYVKRRRCLPPFAAEFIPQIRCGPLRGKIEKGAHHRKKTLPLNLSLQGKGTVRLARPRSDGGCPSRLSK
jgi:hypothetical protein